MPTVPHLHLYGFKSDKYLGIYFPVASAHIHTLGPVSPSWCNETIAVARRYNYVDWVGLTCMVTPKPINHLWLLRFGSSLTGSTRVTCSTSELDGTPPEPYALWKWGREIVPRSKFEVLRRSKNGSRVEQKIVKNGIHYIWNNQYILILYNGDTFIEIEGGSHD